MKRWLLLLLFAGRIFAQTDAPPELENASVPDELPPVEAPAAPLNGKLTVTFGGNKSSTENDLRQGIARQIQTIEEFGLDEPNAYDAAYFLESFYRKQGYSQTEVNSEIVGPWELRLKVNEGPQAHIGTIEIHGNDHFDTATLSNYLLGPIRERYPRIREDINLPFVEADLFSGVDLVRRLYASSGFLDVVVGAPVFTLNEAGTSANIELTVNEGIAYHFGSVRLMGNPIFSRNDLLAIIAEQTKDIFTAGRLAAAERALQDYYVHQGYFQASVVASSDLAAAKSGEVPTAFLIEPGAIFHFDGSTVSGTAGVKPSFIQKRLQRLSGRRYDPKLIDRRFRELIQTGLFRNLRITPQPIEGDQIRLDVSVEEARTKEFGFGLGYASFYGGIVSVTYRDLNFLGNSRPISFTLEANQRGFNGEAVYSDPWLFESDYQLELRLAARTERLKGYSKNEVSFRPTLSRYVTEHWKLSAFARASYTKIDQVDIEPMSLVGPEKYSVVSFGFTQTLDYRNNVALPTRGFIFTTSLEVAPNGLGDVSFVRGVGRFSYYVPITERSSLALGARGGIIAALSDQGIPIDERFFNGGATTVRSFSELTLGPKDQAGYPLGGQTFTVFNAEYTFPLIGDLFGAVFVDAGNVVSQAADFGVENMRYAVGAGLRYNLPIGAIRLDYGLNPSPRDGEALGAFQFAIGVAF